MKNKINYTTILNKSFFEKYYNQKRMSFPAINKMLTNKGYNIATGTIYKYAKQLGYGRTIADATSDLDYNDSFLTSDILAALDGFILGDGSISITLGKNYNVGRLACGLEHKEFADFLMSYFAPYLASVSMYKDSHMKNGIRYDGRTLAHPDLYQQYLRWYPQNDQNGQKSKQPPDDVVINKTSVLLWYLGDGSAVQSDNSISIRLSTDSFLPEKVIFLANKLKEKDIYCHRNNDNRIYIEAKGIPAFFDLIGMQSPIKCYDYKFQLPEWRFESKRMRDVAEELNIEYHQLSYLVKSGRIPCHRASEKGRPRFLTEHVSILKTYISENTIKIKPYCPLVFKNEKNPSNGQERKIHNYCSEILKEQTIEEYGYNPDQLGRTSSKFVIAICRFCGKEMPIRKGFFNKAGSACHKECRIQEQKIKGSPFLDVKVREKAQETNLKRYGTKQASQNKDIAKKISKTKLTDDSKNKSKETNLEKYGVKNVFQSEEIKQKIEETNIKKYGVKSPIQNEDIKNKIKQTNLERYGVENPLQSNVIRDKTKKTNLEKYGAENPQQNTHIRDKTVKSWKQNIFSGNNDNYKLINILKGKPFWDKLETGITLKNICKEYDINYQSTTAALLRPEFKEKYYSVYSFPKQQKQKEIFDWLKANGSNVLFNDRTAIAPLELDIYDPKNKVAIEFNGSYWHSEAFLDRDIAKNKHATKTRLCQEKGIRLIHVFEHTYLEKEEQFKNFLKSAFGLNKNKIAARKCSITNRDSSVFLEKYHIQGKPIKVIKYFNLEYNNEIIGCMTAGLHHERGGDRTACVLSRLAFKSDTTVQGGSSKLFKYFVTWAKENEYSTIISWSDNCISEGKVYNILKFHLEKEYDKSYFYFDIINKKYCTKQSQRKTNKERPEGMTIVDWNNSRGVYAIWDCGKKKWTYNINKSQHYQQKEIIDLTNILQENLSFDLIKKQHKGITPIHGACYIASEALYHLLKENYQLTIKRYKIDQITHWWLECNGAIIDPTKEQFDFDYPYCFGKKCNFLTKEPSKRCKILLERMKKY